MQYNICVINIFIFIIFPFIFLHKYTIFMKTFLQFTIKHSLLAVHEWVFCYLLAYCSNNGAKKFISSILKVIFLSSEYCITFILLFLSMAISILGVWWSVSITTHSKINFFVWQHMLQIWYGDVIWGAFNVSFVNLTMFQNCARINYGYKLYNF